MTEMRNIREAATRGTRDAIVEATRDLRQRQTPSEFLLWEALRNRRFEGRKFRRQARIGHFIVDCYCPEEHVAVEVDGGVHRQQQPADRRRQEALKAMNLRVLRVDATECEKDIETVLASIRSALRTNVARHPSPSPRERGRG